MEPRSDASDVAGALRVSIGLLTRRLRHQPAEGDLTWPEISALARLERDGPQSPSGLAKLEQISPQSMGATLGTLEARDLVERRSDPDDGRRVVMTATSKGLQSLHDRRSQRTESLARALSNGFTSVEIQQLMTAAPLIERLAQKL